MNRPPKVGPKNLTLGGTSYWLRGLFCYGIDFLIIILPSYGQEIFEVLRFLNDPIFVQQNTELDRKIRFRLDVNETKKFSLHLRLPFDTIR